MPYVSLLQLDEYIIQVHDTILEAKGGHSVYQNWKQFTMLLGSVRP